MATLQQRVITKLQGDATLMTMLPGLIWNRAIERKGPHATPGAFAPAAPHQILQCLTVPTWSEEGDSLGPGASFFGFPIVWIYAFDDLNGNGRAALGTIWERCFGLLNGWVTSNDNGTGNRFEAIGRIGIRDDAVIDGAIVETLRLQVDGLWRRV